MSRSLRDPQSWSAPGFARSARLIAGGRCSVAGPGATERASQLAYADLNEGVLSKGRETLGERFPSPTVGGLSRHRQTVDIDIRQSASSRVGIFVGAVAGALR